MKERFLRVFTTLGFALIRLVLRLRLRQNDSSQVAKLIDEVNNLDTVIYNETHAPVNIFMIVGPDVCDLLSYLDERKELANRNEQSEEEEN